jgi:Fe-S-cluster containining protein
MLLKGFSCKQCGNCCLNLSDAFSTCVDETDIKQWEEKGRNDILEWVAYMFLGEGAYVYDIWFNPKTGEEVERCPWLRKLPKINKYVCRIHHVKPRHCREYPKSRKHAEKTGCKGFD